MNYADIKEYDVANGPGVRFSLFVSGCPHHCKNCFNEETWDYSYGKPFTEFEESMIISVLKNKLGYIYDGLSILGGEPFADENKNAVLHFVKKVKKEIPDINIWMYSGFLFEELIKDDIKYEILTHINTLVDGRFVESLKDLKLRFRGSSNQRIIDVQESLKTKNVKELYNYYK